MTSVGVVAHAEKELDGGLTELRTTLAGYGINDPLARGAEEQARARTRTGARRSRRRPPVRLGRRRDRAAAIDALVGRPVTIAIVPAGTANLLATNLGLPQDLDACVRIGLHGARRSLDVGKVNGEHFAVMAGAGWTR